MNGNKQQRVDLKAKKCRYAWLLPHVITICDSKADCADVAQKISTVSRFQVHHYMLLVHAHSYINSRDSHLRTPKVSVVLVVNERWS